MLDIYLHTLLHNSTQHTLCVHACIHIHICSHATLHTNHANKLTHAMAIKSGKTTTKLHLHTKLAKKVTKHITSASPNSLVGIQKTNLLWQPYANFNRKV